MTLPLLLAGALSAAAVAGPLRPASSHWVQVEDTALLCTGPQRTGQCVRFRAPQASGPDGSRLFRLVGPSPGGELEIQARYLPLVEACGVLPARITTFTPRLYVAADATTALATDDPCVLPDAGDMPGPGRDTSRLAERVAVVAEGAVAWWPDGGLAGKVRRDLWLFEENAPFRSGSRLCASFDLGPDDGGPVQERVLDVCFDETAVRDLAR